MWTIYNAFSAMVSSVVGVRDRDKSIIFVPIVLQLVWFSILNVSLVDDKLVIPTS